MIKNYMEDAVDHILPKLLEDYGNICKCNQCLEDIKAIALNSLEPRYVVTDKGSVYVKLNELINQFNTDVIKELVKAIDIVSNNPRHD